MQAFDSLLANPVAEYLKMSKEIGGDVQKHVRTRGPFFLLLFKDWKLFFTSLHPHHRGVREPPDSFSSSFIGPGTEMGFIFLGLLFYYIFCVFLL